MKTLCKSWKRYLGIRAPRCNGGKGCKMCWRIYQEGKQTVDGDR